MTPEKADQLLRWTARVCGAGLIAVLPWPLLLGFGNASYLAILVSSVPLWALFAGLQDRTDRATFLRLALIAVSIRAIGHFALYAWSTAGGGPYLGPDSTVYFQESQMLSARGFAIESSPALFFGSWDCLHFYLFAAAHSLFGADLYGLQTLNVCLSAFAGPLVFSLWRTLGLRHAVLLGAGVAAYPSLVALSINDLLKDPSILSATAIGVWALVRLTRAHTAGPVIALTIIATVSLGYVRMARFYVLAFLEIALIAAMALNWMLTRQRGGTRRHAPALAVLAVIGLVEALPMLLGWPATPRLLMGAVSHTLDTPLMRMYASGLVDYARSAPSDSTLAIESGGASGGGVSTLRGHAARASRVVAGGRSVSDMPADVKPDEPAPEATAPPMSDSWAGLAIRVGVNGVRKLLGPFPWVAPPAWTPEVMLLGDYLLFPGVVMWYALFPVAMLGLPVLAWRIFRDRTTPAALIALGVFALLLFGQYLALNLSYRQREFMVPFMAGIALVTLPAIASWRGWRYVYGAYWVLLVVMAVAHLAVRAAVDR